VQRELYFTEVPDRPVNRDEMATVAQRIGFRWKDMGRAMGIPDHQLDCISHDYERDGLNEKVRSGIRIIGLFS